MEDSNSSVVSDSSPREAVVKPGATKQRRSVEQRRRIVEASLAPGATTAKVAAKHGVRPNQVSAWRKMYREGRLGGVGTTTAQLLPVKVVVPPGKSPTATPQPGEGGGPGQIQLELPRGQVRIVGQVSAESLRLVLESLLR